METINKNILLAGEVVAKKWKVVEKIGEGTFSQIYSAYALDTDERVAIKVEAPSALKPVLEWEAMILKNLQKCPHVCRYYYHGKHGESTVLVMELLGESMSMLRVTPEAIHGVPISKCISVGIEMLDCIVAFHKHGYVHRDIKASNFALTAGKIGTSMTLNRRYLLIDFGLSRQHIENGTIIPARTVAEFRGTSMYASLSAHRRLELGPKDDLWSWFYLVLDFMRGELPWANDAQQKNRQMVFQLKEYYTEKHPGLLVEGLPGASHLLAMVKYLMSLSYEAKPDYKLLKDRLKRVAEGTDGEDTIELWDALGSYRERVLQWTMRANDALEKNNSDLTVLETLQEVAKKYDTFFDSEGLSEDEHMAVQEAVFNLEKKLRESINTKAFAPPPIQSFKRRRESEQKIRTDAIRKRRERDQQVRHSLEQKLRRQSSTGILPGMNVGSPANDVASGSGTPTRIFSSSVVGATVHKSEDSAMDCSDAEEEAPKTLLPSSVPRGINTRHPPPLPPSGPRPLSANRLPPPPPARHAGTPTSAGPHGPSPRQHPSPSNGVNTNGHAQSPSASAIPSRLKHFDYVPNKNGGDRGYERRDSYESNTSGRHRSSRRSRSRSMSRSKSNSRSRSRSPVPLRSHARNRSSLTTSRRDSHYSYPKSRGHSPSRSRSRPRSRARSPVRSTSRSRSRSRSSSSRSNSRSPPRSNRRYSNASTHSKQSIVYTDRSRQLNRDSNRDHPSPRRSRWSK